MEVFQGFDSNTVLNATAIFLFGLFIGVGMGARIEEWFWLRSAKRGLPVSGGGEFFFVVPMSDLTDPANDQ